jgi:hypothetical protein
MTQQTEALRLADELEGRFPISGKEAAAELRRLEAVIQQLLEALEEAADDIESWGAYATEYFQKRHNLQGAVNKARAAIKAAKGEA